MITYNISYNFNNTSPSRYVAPNHRLIASIQTYIHRMPSTQTDPSSQTYAFTSQNATDPSKPPSLTSARHRHNPLAQIHNNQ